MVVRRSYDVLVEMFVRSAVFPFYHVGIYPYIFRYSLYFRILIKKCYQSSLLAWVSDLTIKNKLPTNYKQTSKSQQCGGLYITQRWIKKSFVYLQTFNNYVGMVPRKIYRYLHFSNISHLRRSYAVNLI